MDKRWLQRSKGKISRVNPLELPLQRTARYLYEIKLALNSTNKHLESIEEILNEKAIRNRKNLEMATGLLRTMLNSGMSFGKKEDKYILKTLEKSLK